MKHIAGILIMASIALFTACDKASINGNLDGMWHLVRIDSIGGGSNNVAHELRYLSFQLHLAEVRSTQGISGTYLLRFSHTEDSLSFIECYDPTNSLDTLVADASVLSPYGISHLPATFHIDHLTRLSLILRSQSLRLNFEKR